MTILRIFIQSEDLENVIWQLLEKNDTSNNQGEIETAVAVECSSIEIYLAPILANIIPVDLGVIGSQKINDELLLNIIEDDLADDIENIKPILLKIDDNSSYIAVINKKFYNHLIEKIDAVHKKVKFIQPWIYNTDYQKNLWTLYLKDQQLILRTSLYEYYLLDQNQESTVSALLASMLQSYQEKTIIVYSDNQDLIESLKVQYQLTVISKTDLNLGEHVWNFYKAKTRRWVFKISPSYLLLMTKTGKYIMFSLLVFFIFWALNLYVLFWHKHVISKEIMLKLLPITSEKHVDALLINHSLQTIKEISHKKGVYNDYDLIPMLQEFFTGFSNNTDIIVAITYDNDVLNVFLNKDYNPSNFFVIKNVLIKHMIEISLLSYEEYENNLHNNQANYKGNNSSVLDANNEDSKMLKITDAAFVITIQKPIYKLI